MNSGKSSASSVGTLTIKFSGCKINKEATFVRNVSTLSVRLLGGFMKVYFRSSMLCFDQAEHGCEMPAK